jgi:zinc D-Ala-D-Ala carboxypeptidase
MGDLSRHFSLAEFTRSETADMLGDTNAPEPGHVRALTALALGMEQVRALFGKPLTITSGYRNRKVNAAVGGVSNSAHALGWAADFAVHGMTAMAVAREIQASSLVFDQLIYEKSRNIVHISFDPRLRGEVKTQRGAAGTAVEWGINP